MSAYVGPKSPQRPTIDAGIADIAKAAAPQEDAPLLRVREAESRMGELAMMLLQDDREGAKDWARGVNITFPDGAPRVPILTLEQARELDAMRAALAEKDAEIRTLRNFGVEKDREAAEKDAALRERDAEIARYTKRYDALWYALQDLLEHFPAANSQRQLAAKGRAQRAFDAALGSDTHD